MCPNLGGQRDLEGHASTTQEVSGCTVSGQVRDWAPPTCIGNRGEVWDDGISSAAEVAKVRKEVADRKTPYSKDELSQSVPTNNYGAWASASHVHDSDSIQAVGDGRLPASSNDHSIPRHTWWSKTGSPEWLQYDFKSPTEISAIGVYWFDDSGRGYCRVPAAWKLLYRNGQTWEPVAAKGPFGTAVDRLNYLEFGSVTTSALRLEVQLQDRFSGGVLEWQINPPRPATAAPAQDDAQMVSVLLQEIQKKPSPPRKRADIHKLLQPVASDALKPLHVVLLAGKKDHGPGAHDYPNWQKHWTPLLAKAENVTVSSAWEWPSDADFAKADVIVFNLRSKWQNPEQLDAFLARGGGAVFIHIAVDGAEQAAKWTGLGWKNSRFRHGDLNLKFRAEPHPILVGLSAQTLPFYDESYWNLTGDRSRLDILATSHEAGEDRPILFTTEHAKGRLFTCIMGHYNGSFNDPLFRLLIFRAINWAAHQPVDRFGTLIDDGATYAD